MQPPLINYVYATVSRPFTPGIFLKYSSLESVQSVEEVLHPLIRESLKLALKKNPQIEITTLADIPAGTGLGSSGSFTTALLKALFAFDRKFLQQNELAELACEVEMERVGDPAGDKPFFKNRMPAFIIGSRCKLCHIIGGGWFA